MLFPVAYDNNWQVLWGWVQTHYSVVSSALEWHLSSAITTCVWGADLFKPEWLAAGTQVTSLPSKVCDSHLTLLSNKRAHVCGHKGKMKELYFIDPHPINTKPLIISYVLYVQYVSGVHKKLFIFCFCLMISLSLSPRNRHI